MFRVYEISGKAYNEAVHKFLALLYQLKDTGVTNQKEINPQLTAQQTLTKKFLLLLNQHYLNKLAVEDYAGLLAVSTSYVSKTIKLTTGQNALSVINDRIIKFT